MSKPIATKHGSPSMVVDHLGTLYGSPPVEAHAVFAMGKDRFSLPVDELADLPARRRRQRVNTCSVNLYLPRFTDASLSLAVRTMEKAAYLCGAFVRVPHRKQTLAKIEAAVQDEYIPLPSIRITAPGELILLWTLRDKNDSSRPPAKHEGPHGTASRYRKIQARLSALLSATTEQAGIDAGAMTDCIPLPGPSITWQHDAKAYTLTELWKAVYGREEPQRRRRLPKADSDTRKAPDPKRQASIRRLPASRLAAITWLCRKRGSLTGDQPEHAARVVALSMKTLYRITREPKSDPKLSDEQRNEIRRKIEAMNRRFFQPPLTADEIGRLLADALAPRPAKADRITNEAISRWLDIRANESRELKRSGYNFDPAPRFRHISELFELRVSKADRRHAALIEIRPLLGDMPTSREAARQAQRLLRDRGHEWSEATVRADLKKLFRA